MPKSFKNWEKLVRKLAKGFNQLDSTPYDAGYDCAINGASLRNCHYGWFGTLARTRQWELGRLDGEEFIKKSAPVKEKQP